ncbi:MAG: 50S ribosomal protein L11 methyltransferase [Gemmatimonadota bacterium]
MGSWQTGEGWWALDVLASPVDRPDLAAWLVEETGQSVEERDDGTLVAFAADQRRAESLVVAIERRVTGASIARRPLEQTDWATRWRDGLGARRFGRITVVPSWIDHAAEPGENVLILDPETAFGSCEHGSTRAALTLLERYLLPGARVLDLGSGSGILAIAATLLGAREATGIEIDEESIPVAERNAERNGVASRTRFVPGDAAVLAPLLGPVDLLCSNILRSVNETLLPVIRAALPPNGVAIFAGMETIEAPLFRPVLEANGFSGLDEVLDSGWWAVAARRV